MTALHQAPDGPKQSMDSTLQQQTDRQARAACIGRGLPSHRPSFPADGRIRPELPMQQIETRKTRGADSAIGDLRREFGRIPRIEAPLAHFSLACTHWVAFHYI